MLNIRFHYCVRLQGGVVFVGQFIYVGMPPSVYTAPAKFVTEALLFKMSRVGAMGLDRLADPEIARVELDNDWAGWSHLLAHCHGGAA